MRRWAGALLGVAVVASTLFVQPPPASAVVGPWVITEVAGTSVPIIRANGIVNLTASCGSGKTAVSGYVTSSAAADLRRLKESFGGSLGALYSVTVQDQTNVGGTMDVQAHARCVPNTYFTSSINSGPTTFQVDDSTHLAGGSVSCPDGWRALGATVTPNNQVGTTLLTFGPTSTLTGWEFRGWSDSTAGSYVMTVHCVPAGDASALRAFVRLDNAGWGTSAGAECDPGMRPLNGGTQHVGGDLGAITIYPAPTSTGWTSTSLSSSGGFMRTTVVCVPSANPSLQVTGPNGTTSATSVSWSFAATDPAASGGYAITYECTIRHNAVITGPYACTSPQAFQDMADGDHHLQIVAHTSDGRTATTGTSVRVDTGDPTVDFVDAAPALFPTASPTIAFEVGDAISFVTSLTCWVDAGPVAPCGPVQVDHRGTRSTTLSGLADGSHALHVQATDQAGHTTTQQLDFTVDTTAPVVAMTAPAQPFVLATSASPAWSVLESGSGVVDHSVRWRRAPYDAGFGAWSAPVTTGLATSRTFGSLVAGSTYCYAADARDQAGNASAWAAARCVAVPLDERALTRTGTWTASSPSGWYRTTALSTKSLGATLSRSGAIVKRISLTAQTCSTCGVVGVYVGSTQVGRVNLASATSARKTFVLPAFSLRSGTVKVKVLSTNKLVRIDALGLSRS